MRQEWRRYRSAILLIVAFTLGLGAQLLQAQVSVTPGRYRFGATIAPTANDGAALGTTALGWSDLFLASGAVINVGNGEVTFTFAADTVTLAGGVFLVPAGSVAAPSVSFSTTPTIGLADISTNLAIVADALLIRTDTSNFSAMNITPPTSVSATAGFLFDVMPGGNFTATSGTVKGIRFTAPFAPASGVPTNIGFEISPTIDWGGTPGAGTYEALRVAVTETNLPTGANYLLRLLAGTGGTTIQFQVSNTGVASATTAYTVGTTPATAGGIRLPISTAVTARNQADTADLTLLTTDGANTVIVASASQMTISTSLPAPVSGGQGDRVVCASSTTGKIYFGTIVDVLGCR